MIPYRREIDGLRALAVLPVVLFHAGSPLFPGGFVGVDVFFVISGYLITSIFLTESEAGVFRLSHFYEKRARRILPALFLVAGACIPFAWSLLPPPDMSGFSKSLVALPLFASNIFFWRDSGYFDPAADSKPLIHTWSLSVEEQFYLLYPIFLTILWRISKNSLGLALAIGAASSFVLAEWGVRHSPSAAFFLLPFRAWELAAGALLAVYLARPVPRPVGGDKLAELASLSGLALIAYASLTFDQYTRTPGLHALIPVAGAALIIVFSSPAQIVGKLLGARIPVALGLVSYSAYLIHQPLLAFARHKLDPPSGGPILLGLAALAFPLAYLSWRFVEMPFRRRGPVSRAALILASAAAALFLVSFGMAGVRTDGFFLQRISAENATLIRSATSSPFRAKCHTGGTDYRPVEQACVFNEGRLEVAAFGDSHAVELAFALAEELAGNAVQVAQYSFSSCPPTLGRTLDDTEKHCAKWTEEALSRIVADRSIDTVVVTYRIHEYLSKSGGDPDILRKRESDARQQEMWQSYIQTLKYLMAHQKQVVLVLQAPELPESIHGLAFKSASDGSRLDGARRTWWEERRSFVTARRAEIPSEVVVIDPAEYFCDARVCYAAKDGTALYYDDHHMSVGGATLIAQKVLEARSSLGSTSP
jgi:peptidoglycan/LPS O-acetylase OafA/YrhL